MNHNSDTRIFAETGNPLLKHSILRTIAIGLSLFTFTSAQASEGTVTFEVLTPETALQAARAALENCRASGYQVAVAIVDRFGGIQVVLRDQLAAPRTVDTAVGKPGLQLASGRTRLTWCQLLPKEHPKPKFATCPVSS